ncbi:hypothetical protein PG987_006546 [Apiospora arundinis]
MDPQSFPDVSQNGDLFLWQTGKYGDVRVSCQGQSMLLHRSILSRCAWFKEHIDSMIIGREVNEIKLDQFDPSLLQTLLSFIYSTKVYHSKLPPQAQHVDHAVLATLYGMGIFFKFPEFQTAVLHMVNDNIKEGVLMYQKKPELQMSISTIDDLMDGIRIAFAGSIHDQAALRRIYVHLFVACWKNVRHVAQPKIPTICCDIRLSRFEKYLAQLKIPTICDIRIRLSRFEQYLAQLKGLTIHDIRLSRLEQHVAQLKILTIHGIQLSRLEQHVVQLKGLPIYDAVVWNMVKASFPTSSFVLGCFPGTC